MPKSSKKEKIKYALKELREMGKQIVEMVTLLEEHIEKLEKEIEDNNDKRAE